MIRKSIQYIWNEVRAGEYSVSVTDLRKLVDLRRDVLRLKANGAALWSLEFDGPDFWDFVLIAKIDHYSAHGFESAYHFEDQPKIKDQVEYVLQTRLGLHPLSAPWGDVDRDAAEIVRWFERTLDDAMWEAA